MNTEKIEQLLQKYFEGETTLEEEHTLRAYFRSGDVADRLRSYRAQFDWAEELRTAEPDPAADLFARVDAAPGEPDRTERNPLLWTLRIAAGLALLLAGFSAGLLVRGSGPSDEQVAALQQEVRQMKMALVYGADRPSTASERISAVNLTTRMEPAKAGLDGEITDILIYTLNNDPNTNVRQAAADALFRFRREARIRKALVGALRHQEDPVMQLTLINMLVELKERSAINEMQKLLLNSDTREVVKTRLKVGIAELKT